MSEIDEAADPAALIEAYYEAGWTDGLPVVPPSDASIAAMLAAAGLEGPEELGAITGRNAVVSAEKAATVFDLVDKFAGYGFNKAHSAGYALISFQTAYLKAPLVLRSATTTPIAWAPTLRTAASA